MVCTSECTKNQGTVHFKWLNLRICELYLIKAAKRKKKERENKNEHTKKG